MTSNIILEGINEATENINLRHDFLINHATDQLFYLDEIMEKMSCGCLVLVKETYYNILMLEFETYLILKAIKYNGNAINVDDSTVEIIKCNCDDLLERINKIKELQEKKVEKISHSDFQRMVNNEFDVDLGAL